MKGTRIIVKDEGQEMPIAFPHWKLCSITFGLIIAAGLQDARDGDPR